MKKKIISILTLVTVITLIFSCAEKKKTITVSAHPAGWSEPGSVNFHGEFISGSTGKLQNCTTCHGEDFSGGTSEISCFSSECHAVYPHKDGFADTGSSNFHGLYIKNELDYNIMPCASCHGDNYMGDGTPEKSCYQSGCHKIYPHVNGFDEQASAVFHGKFIADSLNWNKSSCQVCHGTDYMGEGSSKKNCVICHDNIYPHAAGFEDDDAANFHGKYIDETLNFDISSCAVCHGSDYKGNGYDAKNCFECHSIYPHAQGFASPTSKNFHGDYIETQLSGDVSTCQACHGTDLQGNGYQQKNCQRCHSLYPHPDGFASPTSENFHGTYIDETLNFDLSMCQACHGDDFKGDGNPDKNCYKCHAIYPHEDGFASAEAANFHGDYIDETLNWDISSCASCHGSDYSGNGYEEKNCRRCHAEYPHAEGIVDTLSNDFHGKTLAANDWDASSCQTCHGTDYSGNGYEGKNCRACHSIYPHIDNFANPATAGYHGKYILDDLSFDITSCADCHGNDYSGKGYAEKNCRKCHQDFPHPQGFVDTTSVNFHGKYIADTYNWVLDECQSCHGADYMGKSYSEKNCTTCHTGPDGPETCNTCHGSSQNNAPPKDLAGNTSTTSIGVGAHQAHIMDNEISNTNSMLCSACHVTPSDYESTGHINDGTPNAEVIFDPFVTDTGNVSADYSHSTATCNNIYCHGAFTFDKASSSYQFVYTDSVITGNNPSMDWTDVGTGKAACGTCHGLPPTGHNDTFGNCNGCHYSVDSDMNIIDKSKHINGKIDVY